ncbi:uncharacterized protein LOC121975211 [Zingiber officinale]|uniref:PHD-type domain-containing protein n=1 Tax=Zingiber officinale TaxID=94328 RepID=A0A8J5LA21_ZINOF|nr:uncharacterized protein LOC121975211 [Zingiber officinale]XP_042382647.1 uncharacterized protein LOC121975211 [Zingiber officinale]XP_042382648.1 uncharacterized protein LOC121975211 [Zingiber officinale]KAG6510671.1 hypothetical protein ZIOFF_028699 [Zingiber officinale]
MGEECPAAGAAPKAGKRARDDGDLKRVAEIVMVLSAIGQVRGGKEPTAAEKALVAEARERLVVMCEAVRPKELFSTEAVRVVAEDLGLNRSKDPALGFRPPKMSIAEKLMLTKKKMEESKEINEHSSVHSPLRYPVPVGVKAESRGTMAYGASRFSQDKSSMLTSSGGFRSSLPSSHVPVLASAAPNLKQSQINDVQAAANTIKYSSGSLDRALPPEHNGPAYLTRDQVENVHQKIPTISSMQSPSIDAVARFSQPNKMLDHTLIKYEGIADVNTNQSALQMTNQEIKPSMVQAGQRGLHIAHQPSQGLAFVPTPLYTNHNDITKSVQRILQSKVLDRPNWIPPSSDYMNASLNCQICKNVISDTESLLVCDACEKGNHLKCLQSYGSKGIPKAEWHCPSCLASSNGKTLPPKYGKVTRAPVAAPKSAPNASINAAFRKTEDLDPKSCQQKALSKRNSNVSQHSNSSNFGGSHHESISDSTGICAEKDLMTNGVKRDNVTCNAIGGNHLEETNGSVCTNSDKPCEDHNHIKNDSSALANTKEATVPILESNSMAQNSCEHSQSLIGENNDFSKETVAQGSDQDLPSNSSVSRNYLQENTTPLTSESEGHDEKKPIECIDASNIRVVSQGSLQVTTDESKGSVS